MQARIIDYGVGNLHSIAKAMERSGAVVRVVEDPRDLLDAECIVFPGVGAFGAAMNVIRPVLPDLRKVIADGTPTLGVCLGMQILFEKSEESPGDGVSVLRGDVHKIRAERVPHMGWNDVSFDDSPLFKGVPRGSQFYFANSYVCHPRDKVAVGETVYGERFASVVRNENIVGVQFHPEKSGAPGLRFLSNFVKVAEGYL